MTEHDPIHRAGDCWKGERSPEGFACLRMQFNLPRCFGVVYEKKAEEIASGIRVWLDEHVGRNDWYAKGVYIYFTRPEDAALFTLVFSEHVA